MNKPIIIAICGKSATGKDTLAKWLRSMLRVIGIPANTLVSDTTRPPRTCEKNGIDYVFLTEEDFHNKINERKYLEYTSFNGWYYGTSFDTILNDCVNIGVFNVSGISSLTSYLDNYHIICIYLKCNLYQRIKRSIYREHKLKIEYFRRAYTDFLDFKNIESLLQCFPDNFIFNTQKISTVLIIDQIIWRLKIKNFLSSYNKT